MDKEQLKIDDYTSFTKRTKAIEKNFTRKNIR